MWANEAQQCSAILVLLRRVHLADLWTGIGPTQEALDLLEANGGPLSHGQVVMLRVAFALWNGCGDAKVAEVVEVLDGTNLYLVGTLFAELSKSHPNIDSWALYAEAMR